MIPRALMHVRVILHLLSLIVGSDASFYAVVSASGRQPEAVVQWRSNGQGLQQGPAGVPVGPGPHSCCHRWYAI